MKLINSKYKPRPILFEDIPQDALFLRHFDGYLCQKVEDTGYNVIADNEGNLVAQQRTRQPLRAALASKVFEDTTIDFSELVQ